MNLVVLFSLILVAGMLVDGVIVTIEYADSALPNKCRASKPISKGPAVWRGQSLPQP